MARGNASNASNESIAAVAASLPVPAGAAVIQTSVAPSIEELFEQGRKGQAAATQAIELLEREEEQDEAQHEARKTARAERRSELLAMFGMGMGQAIEPKSRGGRPKGSKNATAVSPKVKVVAQSGTGKGRRTDGFNKAQAVLSVIDKKVNAKDGATSAQIVDMCQKAHPDKLTRVDISGSLQALRQGKKIKYKGEPRSYVYFPIASTVKGLMIGEGQNA